MKARVLTTIVGVFLAIAVGAAQTRSGEAAKKEAGSHSMTGCLEKGAEPNTFRLTNVEGKGPKTAEIVEVATGVKLAAHVGHKVTITGVAVKAGKTQATTKSGAYGTAGTSGTAGTTASGAKSGAGDHRMRVDEVKHVAASCP